MPGEVAGSRHDSTNEWMLALTLLSATRVGSQPVGATRSAGCFADDFRARAREAIRGYAQIAGIPGVSFGVVLRDALVVAEGVGYANTARRIPTTADTPYRVASVTKLFTATLAMQLVAEGRLDLDAPVSRYLPDSVRVPTSATGQAITARHLLTHTSGLPRNPPNRRNQPVAGPINPGVWDAYNRTDLYRALATTALTGTLGATVEYSNYGYALLGHVVEQVAGQSYEPLLRAQLLTPLGMTASGITLTPAQAQRLAAFYWDEDAARQEQTVQARFGEVAGFIGLTSTVRDLARFLMAHLGTTPAGRRVLPPEAAQRMREPQVPGDSTVVARTDLGLGWFRELSRTGGAATPLLRHDGEIDGHTSGVFVRPAEGVGVIVLQNLGGDTGALAIDQIGRWLLEQTAAEVARCDH